MSDTRAKPTTDDVAAQSSEQSTAPAPADTERRTAASEQDGAAERTATEPGGGTSAVTAEGETALFSSEDRRRMQSEWEAVQAAFVDQPRDAVQRADGLVAEAIQRLSESFSDARSQLEGQWSAGEEVSTEDLRVALQRYRSFFDRLLAV